MVRQPVPPSWREPLIGLVIGALLSIAVWYGLFVYGTFPAANSPEGYTVQLTLENATECAKPWRYFACRTLMTSISTLTSQEFNAYLAYVFAPLLIALGFAAFIAYERWFDRSRGHVVSGEPVVSQSVLRDAFAVERKVLASQRKAHVRDSVRANRRAILQSFKKANGHEKEME